MRRVLIGLLLTVPLAAQAEWRVETQQSGVDARLRGVSAVDAKVAWASGSKGTVLRTTDGGAHWQRLSIPDADKLDFRDIEGFDARTAVAMAAGPGVQSRVFRTRDGGATWAQVLDTRDDKAFFDCMAFDGKRGWLLGDPVGDRYQLYTTNDGGEHWTLDGNGPPALKDEAAFAASGTCIARIKGALAVVSGGAASRLHLLCDGEHDWHALDTGMARGKPAAGAFSVAAWRGGAFVVGGDYSAEQASGNAATLPATSAASLRIDAAPRGYRSGVACTAHVCIAVGPSGVDAWDGKRWTAISDASFDAISIRGDSAWLSGAKGALAKIELTR
ncbi:WD40/YVTN/BNR-like repeat-containing protein [Solilutibacter silvestris]|uniref:Photosynthesis system II assembly factor Ycf48/Hcf136-like domain-containing protein n=1 Tax=Solilutibacter silvestris TaxID=1645665 RepID=A0A2K1PXU0_9GAMM|nr:YCF48-related protein [Lysobacter silvestris]PNS07606.1 hypothetical protein Lysil_1782 [Lysobacter silvestris]